MSKEKGRPEEDGRDCRQGPGRGREVVPQGPPLPLRQDVPARAEVLSGERGCSAELTKRGNKENKQNDK
eukprot:2335972-Heterocapsa_arctica.AAC.1